VPRDNKAQVARDSRRSERGELVAALKAGELLQESLSSASALMRLVNATGVAVVRGLESADGWDYFRLRRRVRVFRNA
jgi:hypothetical protein